MKKFIVLFVILLSLGVAKVSAQCPPNNFPTSQPCGSNWVGTTTVHVPVEIGEVWCTWIITYCYRTWGCTAPYVDIWIVNVTDSQPCGQNSIGTWNTFKLAGEKLIKYNPNNYDWFCPPCGNIDITPNYQIYYGSCYNGSVPCPAAAYCQNKWYVCCDPNTGERITTYIGSEAIGNCMTGCTTICE
jgi:hypothetical protein